MVFGTPFNMLAFTLKKVLIERCCKIIKLFYSEFCLF